MELWRDYSQLYHRSPQIRVELFSQVRIVLSYVFIRYKIDCQTIVKEGYHYLIPDSGTTEYIHTFFVNIKPLFIVWLNNQNR